MSFLSDIASAYGGSPPNGSSNPKPSEQTTAMDVLRQAMRQEHPELPENSRGMKKGGMTASKRADGIAQRGKTRGKLV